MLKAIEPLVCGDNTRQADAHTRSGVRPIPDPEHMTHQQDQAELYRFRRRYAVEEGVEYDAEDEYSSTVTTICATTTERTTDYQTYTPAPTFSDDYGISSPIVYPTGTNTETTAATATTADADADADATTAPGETPYETVTAGTSTSTATTDVYTVTAPATVTQTATAATVTASDTDDYGTSIDSSSGSTTSVIVVTTTTGGVTETAGMSTASYDEPGKSMSTSTSTWVMTTRTSSAIEKPSQTQEVPPAGAAGRSAVIGWSGVLMGCGVLMVIL